MKCAVCNHELVINSICKPGDTEFDCPNCGKYSISTSVLESDTVFKENKYLLAGYLFNRDNKNIPEDISTGNISELINKAYRLTPFEKIDKLLIYIYKNTDFFGKEVPVQLANYPISYAVNDQEFNFIIQKAQELKYIGSKVSSQFHLTLSGWERIDKFYNTNKNSNQAFVAMWFDESIESIYQNAFAPALKKTGYYPVKINDIPHNDDITFRILAEIRKS